MEQYHKRTHKRKLRPSDHNNACEVCSDDDGTNTEFGRLFKCEYCNVVAHKACIELQCNDLPREKEDSWTCPECAREIAEVKHNSSCTECNEAEFINDDIQRAIKLLEMLERQRAAREGEGGSEGEVTLTSNPNLQP